MNSMETAKNVINQLEQAGFEAFIVGGAVRDFLLGHEPSDVDVATNALPAQVKTVFSKTVDTGIEHGTVLVVMDGQGTEVTTYRTEGTYSDSRRPDAVEFVVSLKEDLKRRDFTINAMAMAQDGSIIDPFGGQSDLNQKIIRAVGNPEERFQEDALRMLRAVRFAGQLGFTLEELTAKSLQINAYRIQAIAVERIKIELDKLFKSSYPLTGLKFLLETGLNAHLPSAFLFETDWAQYPANSESIVGWAFMLYRTGSSVEAVRAYKFSNQEYKVLSEALEAAQIEVWDNEVFYSFSAQALTVAASLTGRTMDVTEQINRLPIRSKSDMAISGTDLMEWTGHSRGPWLREWLNAVERRILSGQLKNDKESIKEWLLHEYNDHF